MRIRIKLFSALFFVAFLLLIIRLFNWQVLRGKQLSIQARAQYQKNQVLLAPRGDILAQDGSIIVASDDAYLIFAYLPHIENDISVVADKLALLLTEDAEDKNMLLDEANRIKSLLSKDDVFWVPIKHKVSTETKNSVASLTIAGVDFELEEKRIYPEASSAAHLLGFVGKNSQGEDQGYFGIEGYYDLMLAGKPGYLSQESDAQGSPIFLGNTRQVLAVEGVDLVTYIDKAVQLTVEQNLSDAIEKYGAKAGTVIVMDPKTGGIVAQASYPSYDPQKYSSYTDSLFKNPAVSSSFEPGSIFKVFVIAAALDDGVVETDTKCEVCSGPLRVDKYTIETWNQQYRADSTMVDVIVHSDNVGMAWVAQQLGADKLYDYLSLFGIGKLTGIDLQGEATPKLREKGTWNIVDLATAGFGQGVATTPIQIIKGVATIANKGISVNPKMIDKIVGDNWEETIKMKRQKRVISEEVANDVIAMMVEAAKGGEAKWTHLTGFKVAGKTGTAQIPISGHYDEEKTIASFVGFAPADNPKFVMLTTLREPSSSPWASETAAPLWYSIAKDLFLYYGIQPEN